MYFSSKRGIEIACRPSVCPSVRPSVCDVGGSGPDKLEILETNCTQTISPTPSLFVAQRPSIYSHAICMQYVLLCFMFDVLSFMFYVLCFIVVVIGGLSDKIKDVHALWTNGISWISASSTKPLESGERDFELVWLKEEESLNIRCEHLSLSCAILAG